MLKVAICDDNVIVASQLEDMLSTIPQQIHDRIEIECFDKAEALWEAIQQEANFDLVFLDIELPGSSGIELANKVRNVLQDQQIQIAFISAKTSYALELFSSRPIDFLPKPIQKKQVERVLHITKQLKTTNETFFEYYEDRKIQRMRIQDILYLETQGRHIHIVGRENKSAQFRAGMKETMEKLEQHGFILINQSEAVNDQYVVSYTNEHVWLIDNTVLHIAARKKREVIRRLAGARNKL